MTDESRVAFEFEPDRYEPLLHLQEFPNWRRARALAHISAVDVPDVVEFAAEDLPQVMPLDFVHSDVGWPIFSCRMFDALASYGGFPHRSIELVLRDARTGERVEHRFVAVQLLEHAVHLDLDWARVEMHPRHPDRVRMVLRWRIQVPPEGLPPLFRVREQHARLFVSAAAKERLEQMGVRGVKFSDLDEISLQPPGRTRPVAEAVETTSKRADQQSETPRFAERPMTDDYARRLAAATANAAEILQEDPIHPDEGIKRLRAEIDRYLQTGELPRWQPELEEYEGALGAFWMYCVAEATDWNVVLIDLAGETTAALVSPDRRYIVFPFTYIPVLIEEKRENNTALLYNMIKAGNLPESPERGYMILE